MGLIFEHGLNSTTKNLNIAFDYYKLAGDNGHVKAMVNTAWLGLRGYGEHCGFQPEWSVKYYLKASKLGNVRAQFNLARLFEKGTHVKLDISKAKLWYTKASQRQYHKAQYRLAKLLENEVGYVTPEAVKAVSPARSLV
jgi:TPR repeat protein